MALHTVKYFEKSKEIHAPSEAYITR